MNPRPTNPDTSNPTVSDNAPTTAHLLESLTTGNPDFLLALQNAFEDYHPQGSASHLKASNFQKPIVSIKTLCELKNPQSQTKTLTQLLSLTRLREIVLRPAKAIQMGMIGQARSSSRIHSSLP